MWRGLWGEGTGAKEMSGDPERLEKLVRFTGSHGAPQYSVFC